MVELGLPDGLFWNLTPLLFNKLSQQYREQQHALNLRAGLVAASIYNVNRSKSTDKLWTPFDFFPREQPKREAQTDEEMEMVMDMWVVRTSHLEH